MSRNDALVATPHRSAGLTGPAGQGPDRSEPRWASFAAKGMPYLLCVPIVVVVGACFVYPIVRLAYTTLVVHKPSGGLMVEWAPFSQVFTDAFSRGIVFRTLRVAGWSTLLDLAIAFPLVLYMRQCSARWRDRLAMLMLSPLLMSVIVRTLGWVVILGPNGPVEGVLSALGLGQPRILDTELAIVIGLAHEHLGYMVLALLTSVQRIPDNLVTAAFNLGGSRWTVFRTVIVPLSMPGIIAGISIVFPLCCGDYATPSLLGGARELTMGPQIFTLTIAELQYGQGAAMAIVLLVIVCLVLAILGLATRASRRNFQ